MEQPGLSLTKDIFVRQERKTRGHYVALPIVFTADGNVTRYKDIVVPDYTNGLDDHRDDKP